MIAGPLPDEQDAAEFEKTLYLVRRRIESASSRRRSRASGSH
jgi:hypothetical protein